MGIISLEIIYGNAVLCKLDDKQFLESWPVILSSF